MSLLPGLLPSVLGNTSFINNVLVSVGTLVSLVPNLLQNGNSPLGLPLTPVLPPFLGGPGHGIPWGNMTANTTNYYEVTPDTGVTRYYNFTVSRAVLAPDGVEKEMLLVNGAFPGPLIEANWGDWIQVIIKNGISDPPEGTALHWHGLLQMETPWYDGVPSVSQCPIAPGSSFTYRFRADLYGTSWWHSHYSAQYADGLFGPMVIHGPRNMEYDIDTGPIIFSDTYHKDYYETIKDVVGPDPVKSQLTLSDNTLIQGKMYFDCSRVKNGQSCTSQAGLAKFTFQRGKRHLLRFINTSAAGLFVISIDKHLMTVVANDFVQVQPYTVSQVFLDVGQRVDVIVKADALGDAFWLRTRQPSLCALSTQPFSLGAIYYKGADTNKKPRTLPQADFLKPYLLNCSNDPLSLTVPFLPLTPKKPTKTINIEITQALNATNHILYLINGQTFRANYNYPLLDMAHNGNYSFQKEWNVYDFGSDDSVLVVLHNRVPFPHPFHIHGQNMYVLDEGIGEWDGKTVARTANPQRRDTQTLPASGYLVAILESTNPGVWPFHCHIAWHVSGGLYLNVMQKKEEIKKQTGIAAAIPQTCDGWNAYLKDHVSEQIDSGLRRVMEKEKLKAIRHAPSW